MDDMNIAFLSRVLTFVTNAEPLLGIPFGPLGTALVSQDIVDALTGAVDALGTLRSSRNEEILATTLHILELFLIYYAVVSTLGPALDDIVDLVTMTTFRQSKIYEDWTKFISIAHLQPVKSLMSYLSPSLDSISGDKPRTYSVTQGHSGSGKIPSTINKGKAKDKGAGNPSKSHISFAAQGDAAGTLHIKVTPIASGTTMPVSSVSRLPDLQPVSPSSESRVKGEGNKDHTDAEDEVMTSEELKIRYELLVNSAKHANAMEVPHRGLHTDGQRCSCVCDSNPSPSVNSSWKSLPSSHSSGQSISGRRKGGVYDFASISDALFNTRISGRIFILFGQDIAVYYESLSESVSKFHPSYDPLLFYGAVDGLFAGRTSEEVINLRDVIMR
ncbi:hypothetical protein C8R44DRAFT_740404 [Mycena epipterygia]|nr:hypothetical protein C8R44DRAFT_740404 [Mycena epipterygia]